MMAFFDTLIQGELENWKTTPRNSDCDSDSDTDLEKVLNIQFHVLSSLTIKFSGINVSTKITQWNV